MSFQVLALIVFALLMPASVRADESEVEYDTQTGYIRTVRLVSVTPPPSPRASRAARAGAAAPTASADAATSTSQLGILRVQHSAGALPDSIRQKVDLAAMTLVQNDRLTVNVDAVVLRSGSGETASIQFTKCSSDGKCMINDSSALFVCLVPVINGQRALPGMSLGGIPPRGRILALPAALTHGRGTITIRAADRPGEDVLMITQPGIEPRFVQVKYE